MADEPVTLSAFLIANPTYLYILVGLLGLLVGSFLNVVILRLPVMLEREWSRDCRALLEMEEEIEEEVSAKSLMPAGLADQLRNRSEFLDLVRDL